MHPNDYMEDRIEIGEVYYTAYKRAVNKFVERINELEKKILDLTVDYKDSIRSNSIGVQNVYNRFIEIENRQKDLEFLMRSDRIQEIIKIIPSEEGINQLIANLEKTKIGELNKHLRRIKNELKRLSSAFNY